MPSITKSILIRIGQNAITLKKDLRVLVNKEEIEHLPLVVGGKTYIRKASSLVTQGNIPTVNIAIYPSNNVCGEEHE